MNGAALEETPGRGAEPIGNERELLSAWQAGSREAGDRLMRQNTQILKRFFVRRVGSEELVEDLAQRTFVECLVALQRFRGDSNFRTWLLAIATNVLREHYRDRRYEEQVDVCAGADEAQWTLFSRAQERQRLAVAMCRISSDSRQLLEFYYWQERTAPEIAETLGIPVGTLRGRIARAKLELRGALDTMERTRERLRGDFTNPSTSSGRTDMSLS